jgi:magnesium chelatase family protein
VDYRARVSGPFLDRIDLQVEVPAVRAADLALPAAAEGSAEVAARVAAAREIQVRRATAAGRPETEAANARASGDWLQAIADPEPEARALLTRAADAAGLTARGWSRVLRLARTLADLDAGGGGEASPVARRHVAEALAYRGAGEPG